MTRKVKYARLHSPLFVAMDNGQRGVDLKDGLRPVKDGSGNIKSLDMAWGDNTLYLTVNGVEVGIPHANVQNVVFAKDGE